ncbi:hypothetical protein KY389_14335 [Paracoccus bogoriensis]|uniref:hypothetical protein n=1 Tax=Paracoccus bogoriensis TaxID=242065 RepID=UPI001CA4EE71|nr:hypothetical protein [Paracoccus bogoriensis]MBW7057839.1 hypothetical protein [Paracoccus bogoriensis]
MKIVRVEKIIERGPFAASQEWKRIRRQALAAIQAAEWPVGSGSFTVYPQSGKKTGEGNGVKPIKDNVIKMLTGGKPKYGALIKQRLNERNNTAILDEWVSEYPWPVGEREKETGGSRPGGMDAAYVFREGLVCFEWETGNISSSHRSLNKMCLGLLKGRIKGGMLVVPSRELYRYLTDRIGNIAELEPYFDLCRSISCEDGVLDIIVIEHDALSTDVPKIPKGTDGRAKG